MKKKPILKPFDAAEYLDTDEAIETYISESLASNDPSEIAEAIGTVARARGMSTIARKAGVSRENLYRSLSRNGDPQLSTLISVLKACGIELRASATKAKKAA
jgi:probable addiction module antidote protein